MVCRTNHAVFFVLLLLSTILISSTNFALADHGGDPNIDFALAGYSLNSGSNVFDIPVVISVSDLSKAGNGGLPDQIPVTVTSTAGDSITLTLTEMPGDAGAFESTNLIFMKDTNLFTVSDTAIVTVIDNTAAGNADPDMIDKIPARINAVSDTDETGIYVLMTETGKNTGVFEGRLQFSLTPSDDSTDTLQVSEGDIISIVDEDSSCGITNGLIVPNPFGDIGAIIVPADVVATVDEVTAMYSTDSVTIDLTEPCTPGGGGGGVIRPGLFLDLLAGSVIAAGGGGLDTTPPSLTRPTSSGVLFDPFKPIAPGVTGPAGTTQQAPLRINGNDYSLYGFSNTIVTNTIETGQFTDMSLVFEEASKVAHVAMYFVDQGRDENTDRDPTLIFDNGNIVKVDPDGIFGDDIQLSQSKEGTKSTFNFGMSFDKPTNKNIVIVAWDDKRNSGKTKILNALQVVGNEIPDQVAHFMPIEEAGEFDLIKGDDGQYVLSQPAETQTVIPDSPQTIVYPEFIGKMDRHDMKALYDSKDYEKDKASSIMVQKFKLDTKLFADDNNDKPTKDLGQAPQLTWSNVGHKLRDLAGTSENKEAVKKMMWQEHLKAEKTLKAYLEQRNHRE